jgi:hypothetical protein
MSVRRFGGRRVAAALALIAVIAFIPQACGSSRDTAPPPASNVDYVPGPVFGVPECCNSNTYITVQALDCPRSDCSGKSAYAVCTGATFGGCTCNPPVGWQEIQTVSCSGGKGSAGFTGLAGSGGEVGPPEGDGDDGGPDPGDGPFFDVGDLGDCSGSVAKEIPAYDCPLCSGTVAYALCGGLYYSACSCSLPPGYVLLDGGLLFDASKDVTPKDATVMDSPVKEATPGEGPPETGG